MRYATTQLSIEDLNAKIASDPDHMYENRYDLAGGQVFERRGDPNDIVRLDQSPATARAGMSRRSVEATGFATMTQSSRAT